MFFKTLFKKLCFKIVLKIFKHFIIEKILNTKESKELYSDSYIYPALRF